MTNQSGAAKGLDYRGKVVLVTGGTKGIGAGIAQGFLAAGAKVVVCGRSAPEALPTVNGAAAEFVAADVRDIESLQALFAAIRERHGRLDVLVNNAGGAPFALADKASPRFHEGILRLNLIAPLNVAQQANLIMQEQAEGGVIIFIGSVAASRPSPGTAAYGAAKAGVLSLASSLAVEWGRKCACSRSAPDWCRPSRLICTMATKRALPPLAPPFPPAAWPRPKTSPTPVCMPARRWQPTLPAPTCCCTAAVSARPSCRRRTRRARPAQALAHKAGALR